MVHKLGDPWTAFECIGKEGDLTRASIDNGASSSHSGNKLNHDKNYSLFSFRLSHYWIPTFADACSVGGKKGKIEGAREFVKLFIYRYV